MFTQHNFPNMKTVYFCSCESETGDEKDVSKLVQKCLNKSVSNRTITKQEAMCEIGKLPMVICSEFIDTISLSGAVKVSNGVNSNYTTFLSRYNKRNIHLDKSLHQFFHLTKNTHTRSTSKKEFVPHYVGGGGQPTYPVSRKFARVEILKHMPWSKNNPLPDINETNVIEQFEEFRKSEHCPVSVLIALERAKNRVEMKKKGYTEPTTEDIEESQLMDPVIDEETRDLVHLTNNLVERTNIFESLENSGFDIGRNYEWSKRINKVSK